ncbi:hypothetical protein GGX14DRAFT_386981 [Mycena pura]|uniref:Uncharacterized protein n=1 Tax=Mycena pura TaxID=153505 RepID=A0AAD6YMW7_9AGAR|nr:hypothetical protein GGX14DRAFT_386981 [Mycena pura]
MSAYEGFSVSAVLGPFASARMLIHSVNLCLDIIQRAHNLGLFNPEAVIQPNGAAFQYLLVLKPSWSDKKSPVVSYTSFMPRQCSSGMLNSSIQRTAIPDCY